MWCSPWVNLSVLAMRTETPSVTGTVVVAWCLLKDPGTTFAESFQSVRSAGISFFATRTSTRCSPMSPNSVIGYDSTYLSTSKSCILWPMILQMEIILFISIIERNMKK
uniref:Putative secreted peptide n=1 Tax=Anopheles braziliensis TaxID=58242 RepID=A0A2M3ZUS5_9DIPT